MPKVMRAEEVSKSFATHTHIFRYDLSPVVTHVPISADEEMDYESVEIDADEAQTKKYSQLQHRDSISVVGWDTEPEPKDRCKVETHEADAKHRTNPVV